MGPLGFLCFSYLSKVRARKSFIVNEKMHRQFPESRKSRSTKQPPKKKRNATLASNIAYISISGRITYIFSVQCWVTLQLL